IIASRLRGKHKPTFTPHMDMGDNIVVINADKVKLTGRKEEQKLYQRYSGYPNGLKKTVASAVRATHPDRLITTAVKGMMPENHLARRMMRRLKVYAGTNHPHEAQQPKVWTTAG
ncbi:MAG: 50S ribosomal protein L13, partial [Kiritimatiellia bacterium]|nr:50S ribosomal protein L13 [Kiritimatiellia bacterium]